jgi:hypothetical protein
MKTRYPPSPVQLLKEMLACLLRIMAMYGKRKDSTFLDIFTLSLQVKDSHKIKPYMQTARSSHHRL